jgi:pimeloyl-ACP methyl ester carboxylesterase
VCRRAEHRRVKKPLVFILALVFASLALPLAAGAAPGDTLYTHPGRLVPASPNRLNLYCIGTGSPTVVFDSGWEDWAPAWAIVQPAVAKFARTCTYDRAGSGFSDPGPLPRTSVRIADELHSALHNAGITGPYILVGHSFGSYNTRVFADRYMNEGAGLVLVDGENGDVEPAAARAADHKAFASLTKELRACSHTLTTQCAKQFFRGLPEKTWSPALNRVALHIASTKAALYDAVISEMQEMPWDEVYLQRHKRSFGARPIRVLTAQNHYYDTPRTPPALHRKHLVDEHAEARNQAKWLPLSSDSEQIFAYKSGHYIELDQPYIVINAIRDVFNQTHGAALR